MGGAARGEDVVLEEMVVNVVCEIVERQTIVVELCGSSEFDLLLLFKKETSQSAARAAAEKRSEPLSVTQRHSPSFDFPSNPVPPPARRYGYDRVSW